MSLWHFIVSFCFNDIHFFKMNKKITPQKVLVYITKTPWATVQKLSQALNVSTRTIQRHLALLLAQWVIIKKGRTPYVQYHMQQENDHNEYFSIQTKRLLDHWFLFHFLKFHIFLFLVLFFESLLIFWNLYQYQPKLLFHLHLLSYDLFCYC